MKAARYYGPGDVRVEQIAEPEAGPGQVKIKIAWNGICGSDLHAYLAPVPKYGSDTPDPLTGESAPITLGHEFSGTIVGLGSGMEGGKLAIGQEVVVEPILSCLKKSCHQCNSGSRNLCHLINFIGIGGGGGGLSEFIAVDERYVHVLPKGVSLEVGACIEPLAVAWHAVKRSGFKPGQSVLILGAGPIGMFLLKVLRSFDPSSTIIMSEPAMIRRELSLKHGATHAIDPNSTDVPGGVGAATGGAGVDVVFDAAGVQESMDAALLSVRSRGTVVNVAIWEENTTMNMNILLAKEIFLTGTSAYDRIHPELLEAVGAGKITGIEQLITSKIAIEDVVDKGILALLTDKDNQVKILVHP